MKNKGFTLIELVIAFFIVTVAVSGAFVVIQQVIHSTSISESELVASFLAQEGLELIRNRKDRSAISHYESWTSSLQACDPGDGRYCEIDYIDSEPDWLLLTQTPRYLQINHDSGYSYKSGEVTRFTRKIFIDDDFPPNNDRLAVQVLVEWKEFGRDYGVVVEENLYRWFRP